MTGRRALVAATVVAGAALLSVALRTSTDSDLGHGLLLLLPVVWLVGSRGFLLEYGKQCWGPASRTRVGNAVAVAVAAWLVFLAGDELFRQVPWLHHQVGQLLHRADAAPVVLTLLVTVTNGVAEELFFRGAVYDVLPQRPVLWSTLIDVAVTTAGGNLALAVAAAVLGTVCALQRRATGGILAPVITHVAWSTLVVLALPR